MSSLSIMFVWLDKRAGNVPGSNEYIKGKFRQLLSPIRQFDRPTLCLDYVEQALKDKQVFFITSNIFAEEFYLNQLASLKNVCRMYIYDQFGNNYSLNDENLMKKMGKKRIIQFDERLYEQIVLDLIDSYIDESNRLGKGKDAKQLIEHALKLFNTIDDIDQDLKPVENSLILRLNHLS